MSAPSDLARQRAAARRAQILKAAADCFREHGFHGASVAQISKTARMSPGHIYHYFDNKEAIIASIVAEDVEQVQAVTTELLAAANMREAMSERAVEGMAGQLDPATASLAVEIVAEAARNPRIAEIVRAADQLCLDSLIRTVRKLRCQAGHEDDDATLAALAETLAMMFDGLLVRAIRNPEMDRERLVGVFRRAVLDLLDQPSG